MDIAQWITEALRSADMGQAELARRMTKRLKRTIDRAAIYKMLKQKGRLSRTAKADEIIAISGITRYPLPIEFEDNAEPKEPTGGGVPESLTTTLVEPGTREAVEEILNSFFNISARQRRGPATMPTNVREWKLPTSYLKEDVHITGQALVWPILGDAGYNPAHPDAPGALKPGDRVIVDLSDKTPSPPGPFLCANGVGGAEVKEVEIIRNKGDRVRLSTKNPQYQAVETNAEDAGIIGRVRVRISLL